MTIQNYLTGNLPPTIVGKGKKGGLKSTVSN